MVLPLTKKIWDGFGRSLGGSELQLLPVKDRHQSVSEEASCWSAETPKREKEDAVRESLCLGPCTALW